MDFLGHCGPHKRKCIECMKSLQHQLLKQARANMEAHRASTGVPEFSASAGETATLGSAEHECDRLLKLSEDAAPWQVYREILKLLATHMVALVISVGLLMQDLFAVGASNAL